MSYSYHVDPSDGAYTVERGVTSADIYAHFQISEEELSESNHGHVPDIRYGSVIYLPEKVWKTDVSKEHFSHHEEDTNYSSEQQAAAEHEGGQGYDASYGGGHGHEDASHELNKVQFAHHEEDTDFNSLHASAQEHVGGGGVSTY